MDINLITLENETVATLTPETTTDNALIKLIEAGDMDVSVTTATLQFDGAPIKGLVICLKPLANLNAPFAPG